LRDSLIVPYQLRKACGMIEWHHLLGAGLADLLEGSGYEVVMEKELSLKKQRLDILIIEKKAGQPILELPDGLGPFAQHNLVTYKSVRQALDAWTLDELLGHCVNYRKQISPSPENLLPENDFKLYAVCTRHPDKLEKEFALQPVQEGVYDLRWGSRLVRVIVLSEILQVERNALWLLFSGLVDKVQYGFAQYKSRQHELPPLLNKIFESYQIEGIPMPYTVEDVRRELRKEFMATFTAEELRGYLPTEERLKGLPPEERLKGLPPEERLKGLTKKQIEDYLKKLSTQSRRRKH
jgi:hypothetical protein